MDGAGNVYVADQYNHRVEKYTSTGALLATWGGYGSADGKMTFPYGIDVDRAGNVYVADYYNSRIQKFTSSGTFLMKVGTPGTGPGQFHYPAGVAVDGAGNIYVADQYNHRVQKFDSRGTFVMMLGGNGTADDQMRYPTNIAFDRADNVYVADHGHHRIQKFTPTGTLIALWGVRGSGPGEFWSPTGIAVDGAGTVYVADTNNNRIETFARQGASLNTTATPTPTPTANVTPVPRQPYPAPHLLPARVEAEDYDTGGEGVAYHDLEPANLGGAYRPAEGVDVETEGGITSVGWTRAGESLEDSVDATVAGTFTLTLRASNPDAQTKTVKEYVDNLSAGAVPIGPTGGWTTFHEFNGSAPVTVPQGRHVVRLAFEGVERVNLDRLDLTAALPPQGVVAVPGGNGTATDPDGSGKCSDVNGNERRDFADVVLFFDQMAWIAANEPLSAFDYNGNGRIDFADAVWLFNHL